MGTFLKVSIFAAPVLIFGATYYAAGGSDKNEKYSRQSYYKESLLLLKGYKPAMDKLGEPIKAGAIRDEDEFNQIKENNVQIKLPIIGKERSADMLIYANKTEEDRNWTIKKLELQYNASAYRYKFYDDDLRKK
jgi:hypothetical protein